MILISKPSVILLTLFIAMAGVPSPGAVPDNTTEAVRFTVIDTEGQPVKGVVLKIEQQGQLRRLTRLTDAAGKAEFQLDRTRTFFLYATREGYYTTSGERFRGGMMQGPEGGLVPRKMPSAYTIEIKEIRDPVFLRHEHAYWTVPKTDEWVGLDLKVADWVDPHGMGETVDVLVRCDNIEVTDRSFSGTLRLKFPNEGDGLIAFEGKHPFTMEFGSNLVPPHRAPTEGYVGEFKRIRSQRPGEPFVFEEVKGRHYLFRVRTRKDAEGRIYQACYGWIIGEIRFDPRGRWGPQLSFRYLFNPDPDPEARSLENRDWLR